MSSFFNPTLDLYGSTKKVTERSKYQTQYRQGVFPSQIEDYYKFCSPYYYLMGNDYMQLSRPSIININNVNAGGNALIINNQPTGRSTILQEKGILEKVFDIQVDKEYYKKKYA
jgi:hypothetical protein